MTKSPSSSEATSRRSAAKKIRRIEVFLGNQWTGWELGSQIQSISLGANCIHIKGKHEEQGEYYTNIDLALIPGHSIFYA